MHAPYQERLIDVPDNLPTFSDWPSDDVCSVTV